MRTFHAQQGLIFKSTCVFDWESTSDGAAALYANFNALPQDASTKAILMIKPGLSPLFKDFPNTLSMATIFHSVRCAALKFRWMPYFQNDSALQIAYVPITMFYDKDGADFTPMTTTVYDYAKAVQQERLRTFNMARPFKVFVRSNKYPMTTKWPIS